MTTIPIVLQPGLVLTTAPVNGIIGGANSQTTVKRAVFVNTTTVAVTITAFRVLSAGTAGVTNTIIPGRSLAAGATDLAPELAGMVLNGGDTIQCEAGTTAVVNFFASGFVTT